MTTLRPFTVRILTGSGASIDVPCRNIQEATDVLDAAERDGYRACILTQPGRRFIIKCRLPVEE